MTRAASAQPDVTLLLDMSGMIREATVSSILSDESLETWLGRSWVDTVADFVADKVQRIVADAKDVGISAFRQLTQRFPSGREVPMEYTTVLLGGHAGLLAIGKSLISVAELQSRFVAAQQALERDYWKLREVEARYRLIFDHATEAILLVRPGDLTIEEANPVASAALGVDKAGRKKLLTSIRHDEQDALRGMLQRASDQGRAPGVGIHLGEAGEPWTARAAAVTSETEAMLLVQMAPACTAPTSDPSALPGADTILGGLPDAFVLIDGDGIIHRANQAFVDLVDMPSTAAVAGEQLDRWVWRPGADLSVLLTMLRNHQTVRLFPSTVHGDFDAETEVEISATVWVENDRTFYGLVMRDVGRRLAQSRDPQRVGTLIEAVAEPVGKLPLKQLIRSTVDDVERHYIRAALDAVGGNRSAAADLLGLSRQSLYIKLGRYGFESETQAEPQIEG